MTGIHVLLILAGTCVSCGLVHAASDVVTMEGGGGSNPSKYFIKAMQLIQNRAPYPTRITYRSIGSRNSQYEMLGNDKNNYKAINDFGCGDTPIPSGDPPIYEDFASKAQAKVLQIPFAMGAIGVFFNGNGVIKNLKLDGCTLARIFSRQITKWNHADIIAINGDATLPDQDIVVIRRSPGSSSTAGITGYMAKASKENKCLAAWPSSIGDGLDVNWPENTVEVISSGTMSSTIKNTPYSIGYVDAGHGYGKGLTEVQLADANGEFLFATNADMKAAGIAAVDKNLFPADPTANWWTADLKSGLLDLPGKNVWPITLLMYVYVRQDLSAMENRQASILRYFLDFILSEEGQLLAETPEFGFVGVPVPLLKVAQAGVNSITMPTGAKLLKTETTVVRFDGASEDYISKRRTGWGDWKMTQSADAIASLVGSNDLLRTQVSDLQKTQGELQALVKILSSKLDTFDAETRAQIALIKDYAGRNFVSACIAVFAILSSFLIEA